MANHGCRLCGSFSWSNEKCPNKSSSSHAGTRVIVDECLLLRSRGNHKRYQIESFVILFDTCSITRRICGFELDYRCDSSWSDGACAQLGPHTVASRTRNLLLIIIMPRPFLSAISIRSTMKFQSPQLSYWLLIALTQTWTSRSADNVKFNLNTIESQIFSIYFNLIRFQ